MYPRFTPQDPISWSRRLVSARGHFKCFSACICGYALFLVVFEYQTLTSCYRYGKEGELWQLFAIIQAVGFACFIVIFAWPPMLLLIVLRDVVRELDKVSFEQQDSAQEE